MEGNAGPGISCRFAKKETSPYRNPGTPKKEKGPGAPDGGGSFAPDTQRGTSRTVEGEKSPILNNKDLTQGRNIPTWKGPTSPHECKFLQGEKNLSRNQTPTRKRKATSSWDNQGGGCADVGEPGYGVELKMKVPP